MTTFRMLLAGAFLAGTAFSAAPASAVCTWSPDPVFHTCGPCGLAGVALRAVEDRTGVPTPSPDCLA